MFDHNFQKWCGVEKKEKYYEPQLEKHLTCCCVLRHIRFVDKLIVMNEEKYILYCLIQRLREMKVFTPTTNKTHQTMSNSMRKPILRCGVSFLRSLLYVGRFREEVVKVSILKMLLIPCQIDDIILAWSSSFLSLGKSRQKWIMETSICFQIRKCFQCTFTLSNRGLLANIDQKSVRQKMEAANYQQLRRCNFRKVYAIDAVLV